MYHIWPSYGQTHLFHGQDRDDTARCSGTTNGEEFAVEFVATVRSGIAAMHKYGNTRFGQSAIYFFKARGNQTRLVGERKRLANPANHQVFNEVGQVTWSLDLTP